ncbi:NADPH-dependent F420 reductase [Amycolatopsis sp. NBC_01480]|uniref:NADPH-dependent F420 reductase n=1 Tax=Amycolatopsis sp. NBC_01480 TaxID=2903562 RepID=UPI002E2A6C74|nr:NAD(P)-binding domain-containing protein [Amycolatopsis sp. NBC_01480]
MKTLGLIGSGHIGGVLARLAVDAGLDVVLSNSRDPQTLSGLVRELGPRARAATPAQAAAAGDWVVVTIPVGAVGTVPAEPLAGKTVIDTGNYWAPRDGAIPELEARELTDSELLQRHLTGAHVVKAFNNINYQHLEALPRPVGAADRTACRSPATIRARRRRPPSWFPCSGTTSWTWGRSPKAGARKRAVRPSARPTR